MRTFQIVTFTLAVGSFLAALYFIGQDARDSFWKRGAALMIADVVCILLWPVGQRKQ